MLSIVTFPQLGINQNSISPRSPHFRHYNPISNSDFISDECINNHPRFPYIIFLLFLLFRTLTRNMIERRNEKMNINIPIYKDIYTKDISKGIKMDCMGFGMGCCCLQVTFQTKDITEARYLHDQLTVLAPIMMALTAASPIWHGKLADIDTRWNVISGSCDDRTKGERGIEALKPGEKRIPKSRYSSIDLFISDSKMNKPEYNDTEVLVDKESYNDLISNDVDPILAKHIAHLFVRDPLVVYEDRIVVDDNSTTEHFEV